VSPDLGVEGVDRHADQACCGSSTACSNTTARWSAWAAGSVVAVRSGRDTGYSPSPRRIAAAPVLPVACDGTPSSVVVILCWIANRRMQCIALTTRTSNRCPPPRECFSPTIQRDGLSPDRVQDARSHGHPSRGAAPRRRRYPPGGRLRRGAAPSRPGSVRADGSDAGSSAGLPARASTSWRRRSRGAAARSGSGSSRSAQGPPAPRRAVLEPQADPRRTPPQAPPMTMRPRFCSIRASTGAPTAHASSARILELLRDPRAA